MDKEIKERLKKAFESDSTNVEIAEDFGIPITRIQILRAWHRDEVGLSALVRGRAPKPHVNLDELELTELERAYARDDVSNAQIMKKFGGMYDEHQKARQAFRKLHNLPKLSRATKPGFKEGE